MDRDTIDLIDLGAASTETQGVGKGALDVIDEQYPLGLSDD